MKKKIAFLLCIIGMAAALSGCGDDKVVLSKLKTDKYVTLGEYKGIEVAEPAAEVTDQYMDEYIKYILTSHAEWKDVEGRPAKSGDRVNIDFVGKVDGVAFEGGNGENYDLELGSHSFIEGFEEGLEGAEAGKTLDLNLKFPVPYERNAELSGKDVVFTVTVNGIQEKVTPELTDEIVPQLNKDCKTVEEYRDYVYKLLYDDAVATRDKKIENSIVSQVMANCEFKEPPKAMVDDNYDKVVKYITSYASQFGVDFATYVSMSYPSMDDFEAEAKKGAVESAKESIMLQAIANKEGIQVSQEDIDAAIQKDAEERGYESVEDYKATIENEDYRDFAMADKVVALLKENAVITEE